MLRSVLLAAALTLMATATAGASPHGSTPIDDVIDLTGTSFAGAGCTGGDLTDTSGFEHVTGSIGAHRVDLRARYAFTAVDSLTGEKIRGAGSRHQMLHGSAVSHQPAADGRPRQSHHADRDAARGRLGTERRDRPLVRVHPRRRIAAPALTRWRPAQGRSATG
jgi:hypothetical protein